jgi:hypothetical protein
MVLLAVTPARAASFAQTASFPDTTNRRTQTRTTQSPARLSLTRPPVNNFQSRRDSNVTRSATLAKRLLRTREAAEYLSMSRLETAKARPKWGVPLGHVGAAKKSNTVN